MVRKLQAQDIKGKKIRGKVPVLYFKEGNKFVAFSPALDLSTCGDTKEQARERFIEACTIFFDEITRMGTVDDVLAECGWKKVTVKEQSSWSPPIYKRESLEIPEGVC
jgi:hypothetical protein